MKEHRRIVRGREVTAQDDGLMAAPCWRAQDGGKLITVEPGLIGGEVNRLLIAYKKKHKLADAYKIGPDPSSIDSCMMGGIVANNSSGMCCGVKQARTCTLTLARAAAGSCCESLGWLATKPLRRHGGSADASEAARCMSPAEYFPHAEGYAHRFRGRDCAGHC